MRGFDWALAFGLIVSLGCLGGGGVDAPDASSVCGAASECDDGLHCNGAETCDPSDESADERGCVAGEPPCEGMGCDEGLDRCDATCPDADGDGQADVVCGGTDCDDSDADVFLGGTEVCDAAGIDEDCDPSTLGPDVDGDGFPSTRCCNRVAGELRCGGDCDDTRPAVNPDDTETCNGIDDDCDGSLDEGVTLTFYRDVDGDNYGDATMTTQDCSAPTGFALMPGDCDDTLRNVFPGSDESCARGADGPLDEDCDGDVDEGCDCVPGTTIACGPGAPFVGVGVCRAGTQRCSSAGTYETCSGVSPSDESCNGEDEDCDGTTDEGDGRACAQSATVVGETACGRMGTRSCGTDCQWIQPAFLAATEDASSCDYCGDTAAGLDADAAVATAMVTVGTYTEHHGDATTSSIVNGVSQQGASWTTVFEVGYGPVTIDGYVRAAIASGVNPASGWSLILVLDEPGASMVGLFGGLGTPGGRTGWRAEWNHAYSDITGTSPTRLRLRSMPDFTLITENNTFADTNSFGLPIRPGSPTNRDQRLRLQVVPDDPRTAADETAVTMLAGGATPGVVGQCANTRAGGLRPCGWTLRPGTQLRAAITASTASITGSLVRHSRLNTTVQAASATRVCP